MLGLARRVSLPVWLSQPAHCRTSTHRTCSAAVTEARTATVPERRLAAKGRAALQRVPAVHCMAAAAFVLCWHKPWSCTGTASGGPGGTLKDEAAFCGTGPVDMRWRCTNWCNDDVQCRRLQSVCFAQACCAWRAPLFPAQERSLRLVRSSHLYLIVSSRVRFNCRCKSLSDHAKRLFAEPWAGKDGLRPSWSVVALGRRSWRGSGGSQPATRGGRHCRRCCHICLG